MKDYDFILERYENRKFEREATIGNDRTIPFMQ